MSDPASFPLIGGPWIDTKGSPTQAFYAFCRALWNRTGAGVGLSAGDLEVLAVSALARTPVDVEARAMAQEAALLALAMSGGGIRREIVTTTGAQLVSPSEALSAGDLVNIYLTGGAMRAQKADATNAAKFANGFVLTAAGVGVPVLVYPSGAFNSAIAVATGQAEVWLSDVTPGAFSLTAPTTSGHLLQTVGAAYQGAGLSFVQGDYTIL